MYSYIRVYTSTRTVLTGTVRLLGLRVYKWAIFSQNDGGPKIMEYLTEFCTCESPVSLNFSMKLQFFAIVFYNNSKLRIKIILFYYIILSLNQVLRELKNYEKKFLLL